MSSITCGNCKQTHYSVADVKTCYDIAAIPGLSIPADRRWGNALPTPWTTMSKAEYDMMQAQAERASEYERPTRPQRETWSLADSGIYFADDIVYKVYQNQAGTAMLAKSLTKMTGEWQYEGAAYRFVRKDQRITEVQAKEYGAIYGVCAICGRTLTDECSIAQGIGPVCIKRQGWAA